MKKIMKRFFCLALAFALAFAMAACGSTGKDAANGGGDKESGAGSGTEGTTGSTGTDGTADGTGSTGTDGSDAAAGGVFKIGGIGPTTGNTSIYGLAVKNAAELAVKEINEAGGIAGFTVEFNYQDDENDAEKAVNAYNNLKDWGMQMLMGTVTSTPCVAVVEKTKEDNMFQITPSGSSVESIQYDNAFRVCFSDPNQGVGAAQYIGGQGLGEKVAVIYDSSSVYSTGIYEKFAGEAANQPFEIVSAEAFTAETSTDFSVQLQKAKDAGADLIFLPIYYSETSLILAQASTMGYAPKFFGCDGFDGLLDVENFDKALAEGVMFMTPFVASASDEKTQHFVSAYQEAYGEIPNQFAADAYDAIFIIKAAAEKAGVTPDMSVSEITDALKAAMTEITVDGLTGTGMTWSADGEPNKTPNAVVIKDGEYTAME